MIWFILNDRNPQWDGSGEGQSRPPFLRDTWQYLETLLVITAWAGVLQRVEARILLNVQQCTGRPPHHISRVLRLWNSGFKMTLAAMWRTGSQTPRVELERLLERPLNFIQPLHWSAGNFSPCMPNLILWGLGTLLSVGWRPANQPYSSSQEVPLHFNRGFLRAMP